MRFWILSITLLAAAGLATAQRHKLTINAETPEGQKLQQIGQESDEAKKLGLLEQFATQYPKHEAIVWVYARMVNAYIKGSQLDKALDTCDKLLAADPEDVEDAHECLKAAEARKDADAVKKWSARTSEAARKVAQSPKPKEEDDVEDWKKRVDYAKQVDTYTEYSLYALLLQTADPKKKIELAEALEQRNPQTQYLPQATSQQFLAYQQLGDKEKAAMVAEKVLQKDPGNEDMLLFLADHYMKKDAAKMLEYTGKLTGLMGSKPKPEGINDADWEKKKSLVLGLCYWMEGVTYSEQNKLPPADKSLRAALAHLKGNPALLAEALFRLGFANYKMEKIIDALKFFEQCAAMPGPFQARARANIKAIRTQYVVK